MRYGFLVETYETERMKVISTWSMFTDNDLPVRPTRPIRAAAVFMNIWCAEP